MLWATDLQVHLFLKNSLACYAQAPKVVQRLIGFLSSFSIIGVVCFCYFTWQQWLKWSSVLNGKAAVLCNLLITPLWHICLEIGHYLWHNVKEICDVSIHMTS